MIARDELQRHKKRMCIDYSQTINLFTELDAYPLPRIEDMVNKLSQFKVFSTFELKSAYHQIPLRESETKFTAFEALLTCMNLLHCHSESKIEYRLFRES